MPSRTCRRPGKYTSTATLLYSTGGRRATVSGPYIWAVGNDYQVLGGPVCSNCASPSTSAEATYILANLDVKGKLLDSRMMYKSTLYRYESLSILRHVEACRKDVPCYMVSHLLDGDLGVADIAFPMAVLGSCFEECTTSSVGEQIFSLKSGQKMVNTVSTCRTHHLCYAVGRTRSPRMRGLGTDIA